MSLRIPHPDPVLVLSDLPAYGRVALALSIPLLEDRGIQTCSLPTALLSTHGAYPGAVVEAQTEFLRQGLAHLGSLGVRFGAVYTGFVAEPAQFPFLEQVLDAQSALGAFIMVDPILGDNGKLYGLFGPQAVPAMGRLVERAHLITPNITEAALLLGKAPDQRPADQAETLDWMKSLAARGPRFIALTSAPVPGRAHEIGVLAYDGLTGRHELLSHIKSEPGFPGTGDYFASVLLAEYLLGAGCKGRQSGMVQTEPIASALDSPQFFKAARKAVKAVRRAVAYSSPRTKDNRRGLLRI